MDFFFFFFSNAQCYNSSSLHQRGFYFYFYKCVCISRVYISNFVYFLFLFLFSLHSLRKEKKKEKSLHTMLAAPTTPPNKYKIVSSDTKKNIYQPKSFDTFDSPFHTPSLFGTPNSNNNNVTAAVKSTTTKGYDVSNNKYEQYYYKDDYRLFHHQTIPMQPQHSSSPESFFSVMADLESSGTRTPSPKNDYCYDLREDAFKLESPFLYNHQRKVYCLPQLNNIINLIVCVGKTVC